VSTDAVLRALAEPQRRRILTLVSDRELPAGQIAEHFDITHQAVSQHLRILKDAGLLSERREGTRRLYAIRPEAIESVREFLDELWSASFARLKATVEEDRRRRNAPPS
jgi:DNA-binding transcriptional ArsR family regulator